MSKKGNEKSIHRKVINNKQIIHKKMCIKMFRIPSIILYHKKIEKGSII